MDKASLQILIGKRLKQLREEKNLTQIDLAHLCGFDKQIINRIETGNNNPTAFTLLKIAEKLNVDISELLNFKNLSN